MLRTSSIYCGMPDGIPAPESGSLLFEIAMKVDKVLDVGKTPCGDRKAIVAQEGTLSGPMLTGNVMPGALDFEVRLDSPYAFCNKGLYWSLPPRMKPGGVGITMYDSLP